MRKAYTNQYEQGTFFYHAQKEEDNINNMMKNFDYSYTSTTFDKSIDMVFEKESELYGVEVKVKGCNSSSYRDIFVKSTDLNKMVDHQKEMGLKEVFYINIFEDVTLSWSLSYIKKNRANIRTSIDNYASTSCSDRSQKSTPKKMYHLNKSHAKVIKNKRL